MNCEYCSAPGAELYVEDVYACEKCQKILSVPSDARRLLRGHVCLLMRGQMLDGELKYLLDNASREWEEWEKTSVKKTETSSE
jgi:hypothetical protein